MTDERRDASLSARLFDRLSNRETCSNSEENRISEPITEELKRDFAVHEASHVVIAHHLQVIFTKTSIKYLNKEHGGKTEYCPNQEHNGETWAKVALAGPVGEKECRPESDWKIHGGQDFVDAKKQVMPPMWEWDSELSKFCEEAERRLKPIKGEVKRMVGQYKNMILNVAEHLMQSGELSYEDVKNMIDGLNR